MRAFVCSVLALAVLAAGLTLAAEETKKARKNRKKNKGLSGQITKIDTEKGILTVKVKVKKKQTEDREFKITDKTTVTAINGSQTTAVKADKISDLLKKDQFKVGADVTVKADEEGNATSITFGKAIRKKKKKKAE
jgi:hypothetical protein